jgi:hypothetical protein
MENEGREVKERWVRTILRTAGLLYRQPHRQQLLTEQNKATRLTYCLGMLKYDPDELKRSVFSDES